MNTSHLKYLITIAKHKNLSSAAKELYISQPALTKALNNMESSFNVKLFDRSCSPLTPTYAGTVFLAEAQRILEMEKHLESQMKLLAHGEKSHIAFGIPGAHGTMYLPRILPVFTRKYPNITVDVTEAHVKVLEEKMLNGDIDISFCTLPISLESLDYQVLFDDPIVIAASRSSRFARRYDLSKNTIHTPYLITGSDLDGESFNLGPTEGGVRRVANELFARHSVHPGALHSYQRHETAVHMTAVDENLVVTPCSTARTSQLEDKLAYFTMDNPVFCRKKVICYRKGQLLSPESVLLIETIKETAGQSSDLSVDRVHAIDPIYA